MPVTNAEFRNLNLLQLSGDTTLKKPQLFLLAIASTLAFASQGFAWQEAATDEAKAAAKTPKKATEKDDTPQPTLGIGSEAPSLDISHWVSTGDFEKVTEFEDGNVYVVEFWATWCGPCISSMPHISDLQKKYADSKVQVISVSNEDLETVEGFLKKEVRGNSEQTYGELTANYCLTTDPDRSVSKDYMRAAKEGGIPTAFLVGKTGQIEWIGHPMKIDEPLEQVVADKWDREAAKEARKSAIAEKMAAAKSRKQLSKIFALLQSGESEKAMEQLEAVIAKADDSQKGRLAMLKFQVMASEGMEGAGDAFAAVAKTAKDPEAQNELAWRVVEMKNAGAKLDSSVIDNARTLINKAVATDENAMNLDTQSHLAHLQGKLDEAIAIQTKAVAKAAAPIKADLEKFLAELEEEKNPKADEDDSENKKEEDK